MLSRVPARLDDVGSEFRAALIEWDIPRMRYFGQRVGLLLVEEAVLNVLVVLLARLVSFYCLSYSICLADCRICSAVL